MTTSTTRQLTVAGLGDVAVTLTDRGAGHPFLLLHGGGGPATVNPWADRLAAARPARVITPVHPGFDSTPRPAGLDSPRGLAAVYAALLEALDLRDVTVIGNSIGGWITAEMAVLGSDRVSSYILVDAVGIEVPGHPLPDFYSLSPAEIAQHSYYDPARYGIDPAQLPPPAREAMAANRGTLAVYAGKGMTDPTLAARLGAASAPVLVAWGEADRIGDPDFGRAYAAAIPGARFQLVERAGHLPQIEAPAALIDLTWSFADAQAPRKPGR
jgi:pimeloyl-ACP methyl ester carboxylesterase